MYLPREYNKLFIIFFLLSLVCPIYAENNRLANLYFSAETGWSVMQHGDVSPYQFKDQENIGYRLAMGYLFPLSDKFRLGPEVGYGYYGKISYENLSNLTVYYKSYGWSPLANLTYKITPKVSLALKGGVTELLQHYDISGPNVTPGGFYQRAFSPTLIIGSLYNLSKHTSVGLNYTHIFANNAPLTSDTYFTFRNVNQICSVNAVMAIITYSIS
jgi:OOP family OmpA-OmpF porin